jgi:phospholipase C
MYLPRQIDEEELEDLAHGSQKGKPLSPPGKGLLGLLLAKYGNGSEPEPETYADAYRVATTHGLGLFYPKIPSGA